MASLKDTDSLTQSLEDLVKQLRSELGNGEVDFEKLVAVADELSEEADRLAETFNDVNQALLRRLEEAKGSGSRSRGSRGSSGSTEAKTAASRS
jgi:L-ribulose-5-phosphate 3-epimerase UlaE